MKYFLLGLSRAICNAFDVSIWEFFGYTFLGIAILIIAWFIICVIWAFLSYLFEPSNSKKQSK